MEKIPFLMLGKIICIACLTHGALNGALPTLLPRDQPTLAPLRTKQDPSPADLFAAIRSERLDLVDKVLTQVEYPEQLNKEDSPRSPITLHGLRASTAYTYEILNEQGLNGLEYAISLGVDSALTNRLKKAIAIRPPMRSHSSWLTLLLKAPTLCMDNISPEECKKRINNNCNTIDSFSPTVTSNKRTQALLVLYGYLFFSTLLNDYDHVKETYEKIEKLAPLDNPLEVKNHSGLSILDYIVTLNGNPCIIQFLKSTQVHPVFSAISSENLIAVKSAVEACNREKDGQINELYNWQGFNALEHAVCQGAHLDIILHLQNAGAGAIVKPSAIHNLALYIQSISSCFENKDVIKRKRQNIQEILPLFLDKPHCIIALQCSELFEAIGSNDLNKVQKVYRTLNRLVPDGKKTAFFKNMHNDLDLSLLGYAVFKGVHPSIIEFLINEGCHTDFPRDSEDASLLTLLIERANSYLPRHNPSFCLKQEREHILEIAQLLLDSNTPCTLELLKEAERSAHKALSPLIEINLPGTDCVTPLARKIQELTASSEPDSSARLYNQIKEMLKAGACTNRVSGYKNSNHYTTSLLLSLKNKNKDLPLHTLLLSHNANPNQKGYITIFSRTETEKLFVQEREVAPLHAAINYHYNNIDMAKNLLYHNAFVDVLDDWGETPLFHAADSENPQAFELLLRAGACINHQNKTGQTALFYIKNKNIIPIAIQHGADPTLTDKDGNNAVHYYANLNPPYRNSEKIKALVALTGSWILSIPNRVGNLPIHLAAYHRNTTVVQTLIDLDSPLAILNKSHQTPIEIARKFDNHSVTECLYDAIKYTERFKNKDKE